MTLVAAQGEEKGKKGQEKGEEKGPAQEQEPQTHRNAPSAPPPRTPRHPLRAEFRRGFAPWTGAALFLTLAATLAAASAQWQGGWAETREQLHTAALLLGVPLALAAGCRQGGRERRRRTEQLLATAVRSPLARFLAAALPVACWIVAGYAVTAALALLATALCATGDRPDLVAPLTDAVALASAALVGHVVGRLLPWMLTAPLLAVAGYAVLGIVMYDNTGPLRQLTPLGSASDIDVPVWWQPPVVAVWTGGLAVAAVLAYAARRRFTALVPLAAATAAGALLVQTGDGLWHTNTLARQQVCDTSTAPQICVNARYKDLLPQVTDALSGLTDRLHGVRNLPVRFTDLPGEPGPDEVHLPIGWSVVRGKLADPQRFAWEAGMALYGRNECDKAVDPRVARADDAVEHYLAPSPSAQDFDELNAKGSKADRADLRDRLDARARLKAMGDEERRAWLSAYLATARACDPSEVPAL
ncbi:hypothetical protein SAMN04487981_110284 [Streptomyces sp. cf386]|uniref:hypothetical protein n=1 Tax=Streptomyces sp. cf386 TaxID=1761904 RepID=UPI0008838DF3|nr:hypothetical protein [Streptomyces sp. cf386]SDO41309.1 hypothetical protein SAMN04487981_110284 [Streptomyces sp. cf386]